jgi:glycosyltransferase involved in cell wall biosynthesis
MKIVAFARSLEAKSTGRGAVARELLGAMARLPGAPEVDLFAAEDVGIPGCRFHPARGSGMLGGAWRVLRGIASDVRKIRPDVFWGTTHFLPRGLPAELPKVTTLLDLVWKDHPETLSGSRRLFARWMERGLWESSRILCISGFTRDRLKAHWPELAEKAEVVHLAVNPQLKSPSNPARLLQERFGLEGEYVLNVDTFEPRKNLGVLLEAIGRLKPLTFVHCGHVGWKVGREVALARSLPNVRLLGYVGEEELSALYAGALAAVFPSLYEGFHLPPLDAIALGTPVLASDIPVHREILGDAASYFAPGSASDLEARIVDLRDCPEKRAALSRAGPAHAAAFRWERSAEKVLGAFRRVLGQGSAGGPVTER